MDCMCEDLDWVEENWRWLLVQFKVVELAASEEWADVEEELVAVMAADSDGVRREASG